MVKRLAQIVMAVAVSVGMFFPDNGKAAERSVILARRFVPEQISQFNTERIQRIFHEKLASKCKGTVSVLPDDYDYTSIFESLGKPPQNPHEKTVQTQLAKGIAVYERMDLGEAISLLKGADGVFMDHIQSFMDFEVGLQIKRYLIAATLLNGDKKAARRWIKEALTLNPDMTITTEMMAPKLITLFNGVRSELLKTRHHIRLNGTGDLFVNARAVRLPTEMTVVPGQYTLVGYKKGYLPYHNTVVVTTSDLTRDVQWTRIDPKSIFRGVSGELGERERVIAEYDPFLKALAAETGASLMVWGGFFRSGEEMILEGQLFDVPMNKLSKMDRVSLGTNLRTPESKVDSLAEKLCGVKK